MMMMTRMHMQESVTSFITGAQQEAAEISNAELLYLFHWLVEPFKLSLLLRLRYYQDAVHMQRIFDVSPVFNQSLKT